MWEGGASVRVCVHTFLYTCLHVVARQFLPDGQLSCEAQRKHQVLTRSAGERVPALSRLTVTMS